MAKLYADEQFPLPVVELLRTLGHDVMTVQPAGNVGGSDPEVLAFAVSNETAVLTQNRRDFMRLHLQQADHRSQSAKAGYPH
jgi:predicted nuclease of predicted toxin-antitoxin system